MKHCTALASCFVVFILLMQTCSQAQNRARHIFISPGGDDRNNGAAIERPLKTIAAGLYRAEAGDTVYLLPGVYKEKIKIDAKKGLPENYIYLYGYPLNAKQRTVIDGGAPMPAMNLVNNWMECNNSEWVEIGNMVFKNGWTDPIRIDNSSYLTFKNCDFFGGRKVILATGVATHHLLIEECTWDQGGERLWAIEKDSLGVDAWLSMHHQLMGYYNGSLVDSHSSGGSFVIRNNLIKNAYNGIRFTSKKGYDANMEIYNNTLINIRDNDFEPEHYAYNMLIYHNRSHNIHKSMSVDDVAGGHIYYFGNTVTMDSTEWARKICTGFWKIYAGEDSLTLPMYAFNNSFFGYGKAFNVMEAKAFQLKHFNNAYYFGGEGGWVFNYTDSTNALDYDISNMAWSETMAAANMEQHGIIANPDFINPLKNNLQLSKSSPAIDAGRVMSFDELGWTQTYRGKAPDIGAYEGDRLVDGPAFRFRMPGDAKFSYAEKPRIVKYRMDKNTLTLYFSTEINPATLSASSLILQQDGKKVSIRAYAFPNSPFELVIKTNTVLHEGRVALGFSVPPAATNGQSFTGWASAIPIIKQK